MLAMQKFNISEVNVNESDGKGMGARRMTLEEK